MKTILRRNIPMSFFISLVTVGLLLSAAGAVAAPAVRLKSTLDKQEVRAGEEFTMRIQLAWQVDENNPIVIGTITPPSAEGVSVVTTKEKAVSSLAGATVNAGKEIIITMRAENIGSVTLSPARVEYYTIDAGKTPQVLRTKSYDLSVISWQRQRAQQGLVLIIIIGAGALVYYFFHLTARKKRARQKQRAEQVSYDSEKKALIALQEARIQLSSGEIGRYYSAVFQAVQVYVKEKYGSLKETNDVEEWQLWAHEQGVDQELVNLSSMWCAHAERIRFSGLLPDKNETLKLQRETERYFKKHIIIESSDTELTLIGEEENSN